MNMRSMKSIGQLLTVVASSLLFATNSLAATPLTADEIKELAVDAYVYAYPMVLMEITRQVSTNVGATSAKSGMREAPAADKTSNWLPAPASGGFTMNLRLYWPKSTALDGSWAAAPVKRQE